MIEICGPDKVRGHIRIDDETGCAATAVSFGHVLNVWTYRGLWLTPEDARDWAAALIDWADNYSTAEKVA